MARLVGKTPPSTRVRSRGRITRNLESIADSYRSKHPDRQVRWVYDPQHKPELSNVTGRQVEGYQLVMGKDLEGEGFNLPADKPVRHADVVLMSIEESIKEALEKERVDAAKADARSIDRGFYEQIESIEPASGRDEHRPRARGRTTIEERVHEWEVKQRED